MTAPDVESQPRRRWMFWLRLAAGIGLVAILAARTDWRPVAAALTGLRLEHWLAALAIYLASQVASAWRWGVLARPLGFVYPQRHFTRLYFEGMFFSLCLPSSIGGDVVKACRLAPDVGGRVLAGCTVLADRATGVVALAVIGLTALATRTYRLSFLPALGVGVTLLVAALASVSVGLVILNWLIRRLPPDGRLAVLFSKLLPYHERPEVFRRAIGWGLVVQLCSVLVVVEIGQAMRLDLPPVAYFVSVPAVAMLTMLPVSVSGVGVREGGLAWMLATYGVAPAMGITLGVLWFFVTVVAGLVGGIVYLYGGRASRDTAPLKPTDGGPWASRSSIGALRAKIANMSFSIVVPAYNERENLAPLYAGITAIMDQLGRPYEILLVDDGSIDGSARVMDELAHDDRRVKVIRFQRNFGQTAAMSAGLRMAGGDVIITLDADLQNDPADIPMMLDKLCAGFDLVHGWRRERRDALLTRRLPSRFANWIISRITGFPIHDLGCTLKAIRREFAHELPLYGEMHRFIPILAHWRGARCAEVATRHHPRQFGASKYGLSRALRVSLDLLAVKSITRRPPYAIRELVNFDQPLEIGEARKAA